MSRQSDHGLIKALSRKDRIPFASAFGFRANHFAGSRFASASGISLWHTGHRHRAFVTIQSFFPSSSRNSSRSKRMSSNRMNEKLLHWGHSVRHSSCVPFINAFSILLLPLMVGVEHLTIFRLCRKVSVRRSASAMGSPSVPAESGNRSISSHNKYRMGLLARSVGLFAPMMARLPPGNSFILMVLLLSLPLAA